MSDDFDTPAPRIIDELWCITQERYVALMRAEAELREAKELIQYLSLFEGGDARLAVKAERDALRALLAEARGFIYDGIMDYGDLPDRIDAALREEKTGRG